MISSLDISSSIESSIDQTHQNLIALERNLFEAIARNSIAEINKILYQNPSLINASFLTGKKSLLAFATELGNHDIVKLLIEFDVDIPTYSINFESSHPLAIAVKNENLEITKLLIEALEKSEISEQKFYKDQIQSQDSCDPLDDEISEDDAISVQDGDDYQDLLINALLSSRDLEIVQLLTNFLQNVKKIDLKLIEYCGNNLLHLSNDCKTFYFFLEQGLDINCQNNENLTPISLAILKGLIDVVSQLLAENKFRINQILDVDEGYSAIHFAILGGNIDMIDFLIAKGSEVNFLAKDGKNILGIAITEGKTHIVKKIINILKEKYPHDYLNFLNHIDNDELSPIHIAIEADCEEIVELFIRHDINLKFQDHDKNLLYFAYKFNNFRILEILIKYHYDLYLKDSGEKKFLEEEAFFLKIILQESNYKMIKILHDYGVEFKRIFYQLIIDDVEIPKETFDLVNYLEDFYQSKVLDKFAQAYRKFKDQIDVKFDKKDKINFPTFCLFEMVIFVNANLQGGIKISSQMVEKEIDFIVQNPHSLEIFDKISQDFLAPCSFKPSLGFFRIATLVESAKKPSIIDKLAVLQRLQIFEIINFQIVKFCLKDSQDSDYFAKTTILAFEIIKKINKEFSVRDFKDISSSSHEAEGQSQLSINQNGQINKQDWQGISSFEYNSEIQKYLDGYLKNQSFTEEIYQQSFLILRSEINEDYVDRLFEDEISPHHLRFLSLMLIDDELRNSYNKEIQDLQKKINEESLSENEFKEDNLKEICDELIAKDLSFSLEIKKQALEFIIKELKLFLGSKSQSTITNLNPLEPVISVLEVKSQTPKNSLKRTREFLESSNSDSQSSISIANIIDPVSSVNTAEFIIQNQAGNLKAKSKQELQSFLP
jgi:ankyrin repeat protein